MRIFRNFLIGLFLIVVGIAALSFIPLRQAAIPTPWEITTMPDGKSEVIGIHLGTTTYDQTKALFHEIGEVAAFAEEGKTPTVEAFFNSVQLGGLTGKLVLNLDVPEQEIIDMMSRANGARLQESGARRYDLRSSDIATILDAPIIVITYAPSVKLNAEIARFRFGEPESIEQDTLNPNITIWHYPSIGLTIQMNDKEKTTLQYQ